MLGDHLPSLVTTRTFAGPRYADLVWSPTGSPSTSLRVPLLLSKESRAESREAHGTFRLPLRGDFLSKGPRPKAVARVEGWNRRVPLHCSSPLIPSPLIPSPLIPSPLIPPAASHAQCYNGGRPTHGCLGAARMKLRRSMGTRLRG